MTGKIRFYHNPRCSKSREAKKILDEKKIEYETCLYLDDPPSLPELRRIAKQVDGGAASLLRGREAREAGWKGDSTSEEEMLTFIAEHPHTLQRPVLQVEDRAVVGRPPERVNEIL